MILNEPPGLPALYGSNMVAVWLGVSADAVGNWMRRFDDIPVPDAKTIGPARVSYQWREDKREEWLRWAAVHGVCHRPLTGGV
jgi:hypothetical protein